jgi:AbrB family looped-hinge helix DNA binding protein
MTLLTVSPKGWVVIPAELRRKYGLKPGVQLRAVDYGGVLALLPIPDDPVDWANGMLRGDTSLTRSLLDEHAQEAAHE